MTRPEFELDGIRLINGDCLEVMPTIEAGSVDLILSDLPYGSTACRWDSVIPFEPLWACFKHVLKPKGAVVLTASQPFTSMLVMSNREWFKYEWVWEKSRPTDFVNARNKPMKRHENVLVFSNGTTASRSQSKMTYQPQGILKTQRTVWVKRSSRGYQGERLKQLDCYPSTETGFPSSILKFASESKTVHPTQKPVPLFEYLIKTYSNEGETVLDATIGSGTTAIAALNTNRRCVGIERDPGYFATACDRVKSAQLPLLATGTQ